MTTYRTVTGGARDAYAAAMRALGERTTYPLGADRFAIDRGDDLFAFVDRLGEAEYDLAFEGDALVGMAAAVLLPRPIAGSPQPCWYLCDLKVSAHSRNPVLSLRLFTQGIEPRRPRADRVYLISMNPADGPNRVAQMLLRLSALNLAEGPQLSLFSLSPSQYLDVRPLLVAARGPLSLLRLEGVKDIVLQSTGEPMPLWHVQWGEGRRGQREDPPPDGVQMFCVPDDDPLLEKLSAVGLVPHATATVLHSGMQRMDWGWVLTSEI